MVTVLIIFMRIKRLNLTKIAPVIQQIPRALAQKMSTTEKVGGQNTGRPSTSKSGGGANVPCPPTDLYPCRLELLELVVLFWFVLSSWPQVSVNWVLPAALVQ